MSDKKNNNTAIQCGVLKINEDWAPLVCDTSTGDVIIIDAFLGQCILSNLAVTKPMLLSQETYIKACVDSNSDGYIFTETSSIRLKDYKAEITNFTNLHDIDHVVEFDVDTECSEDYTDYVSL